MSIRLAYQYAIPIAGERYHRIGTNFIRWIEYRLELIVNIINGFSAHDHGNFFIHNKAALVQLLQVRTTSSAVKALVQPVNNACCELTFFVAQVAPVWHLVSDNYIICILTWAAADCVIPVNAVITLKRGLAAVQCVLKLASAFPGSGCTARHNHSAIVAINNLQCSCFIIWVSKGAVDIRHNTHWLYSILWIGAYSH